MTPQTEAVQTRESPGGIAEYDEICLAQQPGWAIGFLEKNPQPFASIWRAGVSVAVATGALCIVSIISLLTHFSLHPLLLILAGVLGFGVSILIGIVVGAISITAFQKANAWAMQKAGLPTTGMVLFFTPPLPANAAKAYRKARKSGLFANIMILAPLSMFTQAWADGDPFIIGFAENGQTRLIAQFDLGKDREETSRSD